MNNEKKKLCLEGPIMTVLGIVCLILSLKIRKNPVKVEGFLNVLVQAKMVPILVSILIIILGIVMTIQLQKGQLTSVKLPRETWMRALILTVMTVVYLVVASKVGFLVPTFVYCFLMLLYLNWKQKNPVLLLGIAAIYTAVTVYLVPWILRLNLM